MPTNIPAARQKLLAIAETLHGMHLHEEAAEIAQICHEDMTRKQSGRRAPVQRAPITQGVIASVMAMAANNPTMPQEEIAAAHDIDGGRVSEILRGLRT